MLKSAAEHPLSSRRILTGLLGAPIAHSASPAMHERTAEALGLRWPLISVEDAAGTLAVVEAVSEAARTGAGISPSKITEYIA